MGGSKGAADPRPITTRVMPLGSADGPGLTFRPRAAVADPVHAAPSVEWPARTPSTRTARREFASRRKSPRRSIRRRLHRRRTGRPGLSAPETRWVSADRATVHRKAPRRVRSEPVHPHARPRADLLRGTRTERLARRRSAAGVRPGGRYRSTRLLSAEGERVPPQRRERPWVSRTFAPRAVRRSTWPRF
jgi:hypothetical protein